MQTDRTTEELGVNTDPDWESEVEAMLQYSSSLTEQYDSLMRKQDEQEVSHEKDKQQLQRKKEEATRHHQVRSRHTHTVTRHGVVVLCILQSDCFCGLRVFWRNWILCELNCS